MIPGQCWQGRSRANILAPAVLALAIGTGCGSSLHYPFNDAGPGDAGPGDAGPGDAGPGDAGPGDAGPGDAGPGDAGPGDPGPGDAGPGDPGPDVAEPNSVTEWRVSSIESEDPFEVAATTGGVFFLDSGYDQNLGWLDVDHDTVTRWPLSHPATNPGGLAIRPSDQTVFVTGATVGELAQFDPATQLLKRWVLPWSDPSLWPGPSSLVFDGAGRVIFSATDGTEWLLGRLDTDSGALELWSVPDGMPARLALAPDGRLVFTMGDSNSPYEFVRFDFGTGVYTVWPLGRQPMFRTVVDSSGNAFFQMQLPDSLSVAGLNLATGHLTTWATTYALQTDAMGMLGDASFVSSFDPPCLASVDTTSLGEEAAIAPRMSDPVTPRSLVLKPTTVALSGQQTVVEEIHLTPQPRKSGAYTIWDLPSAPRMLSSTLGAVYFTDDTEHIGRLSVPITP